MSATAGSISQPANLSVFVGATVEHDSVPPLKSPISQEMVSNFAAATGWVMEFQESQASYRHRAATNCENPIGGSLHIVDMSTYWPAKTPTAHRAKCDKFVATLNQLVQVQLQAGQKE